MVTSIILIAISLVLLTVGFISYFSFTKILKEGVTAEGIIFNTESSDSFNVQLSYPTVRFLTDKNEWITETYKVGLFPGYYKKGKKVAVVYKPDNPKQFVIKSNYNKVVPVIIIVAGFIMLSAGVYNLLNI